jgi:mRNA interferase MazF
MVERFDICLVNLDPTMSEDAKNTRPCMVVSPDEMNRHLQTVIIAPLSARGERDYPTRVPIDFLNSPRIVALDQIRAVDKVRLVKKIGQAEDSEQVRILKCLADLFAE